MTKKVRCVHHTTQTHRGEYKRKDDNKQLAERKKQQQQNICYVIAIAYIEFHIPYGETWQRKQFRTTRERKIKSGELLTHIKCLVI